MCFPCIGAQFTLQLLGVPPLGGWGRQAKVEWETSYFRAKCVNISKTVGDTSKVTIND